MSKPWPDVADLDEVPNPQRRKLALSSGLFPRTCFRFQVDYFSGLTPPRLPKPKPSR